MDQVNQVFAEQITAQVMEALRSAHSVQKNKKPQNPTWVIIHDVAEWLLTITIDDLSGMHKSREYLPFARWMSKDDSGMSAVACAATQARIFLALSTVDEAHIDVVYRLVHGAGEYLEHKTSAGDLQKEAS